MAPTDESVFWELIEELQLEDPRVEEGTIMNGRCARVAGEFLGLVDYKGSGMVVKLPRAIDCGSFMACAVVRYREHGTPAAVN